MTSLKSRLEPALYQWAGPLGLTARTPYRAKDTADMLSLAISQLREKVPNIPRTLLGKFRLADGLRVLSTGFVFRVGPLNPGAFLLYLGTLFQLIHKVACSVVGRNHP